MGGDSMKVLGGCTSLGTGRHFRGLPGRLGVRPPEPGACLYHRPPFWHYRALADSFRGGGVLPLAGSRTCLIGQIWRSGRAYGRRFVGK